MNTKSKKIYICKACNMSYEKEDLAKKCEEWCNKHHSCNMELISHAIQKKRV